MLLGVDAMSRGLRARLRIGQLPTRLASFNAARPSGREAVACR